jgi:hypothetical protein
MDIFEQMGLPPIQDYELDPKGNIIGETMPDNLEDLNQNNSEAEPATLHPEVKQALMNEASATLEKSGVSKSDPSHADLLDLELELRLAQAEESNPGLNDRIKNLRIADIQRTYGKRAPAMLQALGLRYGKTPKQQVSKEDIMLDYLKKKRTRDISAEEKKYKRGLKKEELEIKKGDLLKKEKEKTRKEAHAPLDKEIKGNIYQIDKAINNINETLVLTPKNERLRKALENLNYARKKLYKAGRNKDATQKEKQLEMLNNYLDKLASDQQGI